MAPKSLVLPVPRTPAGLFTVAWPGLPRPVHLGNPVTLSWWTSRAKRTHAHRARSAQRGRRKDAAAAGSQGRKGCSRVTRQQNRFPDSAAHTAGLSGPRCLPVRGPHEPFVYTAGQALALR